MAGVSLTAAQLNRATLARQLLLARADVPVVEAVERLGGLQAQEPRPPFLGLWTRLRDFDAAALRRALHDGRVVRALAMRATLHLLSAADYAALRTTMQPAMDGAMSALRGRDAGLDLDALLPVARRLTAERPRTFTALRAKLVEAFPDVNERALGYAVRLHLPLTMVPTDDRWAFPADAAFTPFAGALAPVPDPAALVRRYLAAFGPASAADVQAWSGLRGLAPVLKRLDDVEALRLGRRELFDLVDAPRPDADVPAPPRLLPEFDSLVLAHKDRTRVVPEEHRGRIVTKNLRVRATFLIDGSVAGTWSVRRTAARATLTLEPFAPLPKAARDELVAEGEALLRFSERDVDERAVALA